MAKKKTTKKIPEPVKTAIETLKLHQKKFKKWKDLKNWEKNSSKTADEWKKFILKSCAKSIYRLYLNAATKDLVENLDEQSVLEIIEHQKRIVYQKHYTTEAKPASSGASSDSYYVKIYRKSSYYDWGNRRYESIIDKYAKSNSFKKKQMLEKDEIAIDGNDLIPRMKWGSDQKPVPKHAYIGSAFGLAMPIKAYEKAIKDDEEFQKNASESEEPQESEEWSKLKPVMFDLNSNNDIHFGLPDSDKYINFEAGKTYTGKFYNKRGKKLTYKNDKNEDVIYYSNEGKTSKETKKVKDEKGNEKEVETTIYEGPRSFMYFLSPDTSGKVEIADDKAFDIDDEYLDQVLYQTLSASLQSIGIDHVKKLGINPEDMSDEENDLIVSLYGLSQIPRVFQENSIQTNPKRERIDMMFPVAFEADILEAKATEPTEEQKKDPNWKPMRTLRLDDQLDSKLGEDAKISQLRLTCFNFDEALNERFDALSVNSRIKVIAQLHKNSEDDLIQGECLWFDIIHNESVIGTFLDESFLETDESDEEINLFDDDEDSDDFEDSLFD